MVAQNNNVHHINRNQQAAKKDLFVNIDAADLAINAVATAAAVVVLEKGLKLSVEYVFIPASRKVKGWWKGEEWVKAQKAYSTAEKEAAQAVAAMAKEAMKAAMEAHLKQYEKNSTKTTTESTTKTSETHKEGPQAANG